MFAIIWGLGYIGDLNEWVMMSGKWVVIALLFTTFYLIINDMALGLGHGIIDISCGDYYDEFMKICSNTNGDYWLNVHC